MLANRMVLVECQQVQQQCVRHVVEGNMPIMYYRSVLIASLVHTIVRYVKIHALRVLLGDTSLYQIPRASGHVLRVITSSYRIQPEWPKTAQNVYSDMPVDDGACPDGWVSKGGVTACRKCLAGTYADHDLAECPMCVGNTISADQAELKDCVPFQPGGQQMRLIQLV
jgi:hypothetical protein